MSLLKWDWHGGMKYGEFVSHHVAEERNRYHFEIKTVSEPPNDLDLFRFEEWKTRWYLVGEVFDKQGHRRVCKGKFPSLEDAQAAAEAALVTLKLEGVI
ncbi:MAG: hypothetical protein U0K42_12030 [Bacteroidales bacterium]|nr:hypothetical protein [Bacteroidales bacterium]